MLLPEYIDDLMLGAYAITLRILRHYYGLSHLVADPVVRNRSGANRAKQTYGNRENPCGDKNEPEGFQSDLIYLLGIPERYCL